METRIIMPSVHPDADLRYTPGPCVVYQPLPARTNGGLPMVPKINGKSLATILANKRYQESLKSQRQHVNAEAAKEATGAQVERFNRAWAKLVLHGQVVAGEVSLHALANAARCSASTLFTRLYRLNLPHRKEAPPRGLVWLNQESARRLVTFHPGNQRGRINNPKKKAPHHD